MNLRIDIPREQRRPRINLTPIMDVVFILVVFFLLAAQFAEESGRTLSLAGDGHGTQTAVTVPARLVVEPSGYRLDNVVISAERLVEALRALGERPLAVEAAEGAPYQALVTALDAAGEAGLRQISIVQPESEGTEP